MNCNQSHVRVQYIMRKKIILDCDGILANWTSYLLSQLDTDVTIDDCYDFDFKKVIKHLAGPEMQKKALAICSTTAFTESQPMLPWAKELIEVCRRLGDVLIVTAPWSSKGWYDARVKWLKTNLDVYVDDVMCGMKKFWVHADIFIDDKPKNVINWALAFPNSKAYLLAWPYNANTPELPPNAERLTAQEIIVRLREML